MGEGPGLSIFYPFQFLVSGGKLAGLASELLGVFILRLRLRRNSLSPSQTIPSTIAAKKPNDKIAPRMFSRICSSMVAS